jgi:flavoprotein
MGLPNCVDCSSTAMSRRCTSSSCSSRTCGCKYHCNIKSASHAKSIFTQMRVDDVAKAEIIARLGLMSDKVGFNRLFLSTHITKLR